MSKKKQDEHALVWDQEKSKALKHLQDTFALQIDPDVVYFILSERDYDVESALEALLTLSKENPHQKANNDAVLNLSDIVQSNINTTEIESVKVVAKSPSEHIYTGSADLYRSNEALYVEEGSEEKRSSQISNSSSSIQEESNSLRGKPSSLHVNENKSHKKSDLSDILSPQSDYSVEADASDIIDCNVDETSLGHSGDLESRLENFYGANIDTLRTSIQPHNTSSENIVKILPSASASRPFYYFPFVSGHSQVSSLYKSPYTPQMTNYFHVMPHAKKIEDRKKAYNSRTATLMEEITHCIEKGNEKILVILRGLPGSGKSTLASQLVQKNGVICSTDFYFTQRSRYTFDPSKLSAAHEWNQKRAKTFMQDGVTPIIIDNTNIESWEMKPYVLYGHRYGYKTEILEPDTVWKFRVSDLAAKNVHGITRDKIQNMLDRYETNVSVSSILASILEDRKKAPSLAHRDINSKGTFSSKSKCSGNNLSRTSSSSCDSWKTYLVSPRRDERRELVRTISSHSFRTSSKSPVRPPVRNNKILASSTNRTPTPTNRSTTPKNRSTTPINRPTSPINRTTTPINRPTSPINRSTTPKIRTTTPINRPTSPINRSTTPKNRPTSPINRPASPINRTTTPINRPTSPINRPASPINKPATPTKKITIKQAKFIPVNDTLNFKSVNFIKNPNRVNKPKSPKKEAKNLNGRNVEDNSEREVGFSPTKSQGLNRRSSPICSPIRIRSPIFDITRSSETDNLDTEGLTLEGIIRKNALQSLKDDYLNEDENFWNLNDVVDDKNEGSRKKIENKAGSPQRARCRTRHSKGNLKTMEDIEHANLVSHDISLSGSDDSGKDITQSKARDSNDSDTVKKRTKTKIAASFGLPFLQYSGIWSVPVYTESENTNICLSDSSKCNAQAGKKDVFLLSKKPYNSLSKTEDSNILSRKGKGKTSNISIDKESEKRQRFSQMRELFPSLSVNSLLDLFNKCNGNIEWASNLLLDSNHEYVEKSVKVRKKLRNVNAVIDDAINLIDNESQNEVDDDSFPEDGTIATKLSDTTLTDCEEFSRGRKHNQSATVSGRYFSVEVDSANSQDGDEEREFETDNFNEEGLAFQLSREFACQLQQLFGPPSYPDASTTEDDDLEIKIDLNLAWQIHKSWAKTMQKKLYDEDCEFVRKFQECETTKYQKEKEKLKRCHSLDRKRSRSCDFNGSQTNLYRMGKTDSAPNMSDIMDMEMAIQMSKDDATVHVQNMWNGVDLATKMKRKLLYERYPYLDKVSIDEVFASNKFSLPDTEEQIQNSFGGQLPTQHEVHAHKSEGQRSGLVRKLSIPQTLSSTESFLPIESNEMKDFRSESELYHQLRQECFIKAREAYNSGKRGAASFYAQEGHTYTQKIWEANRHASLKILLHRNLGRDRNTIDLHLLYVREALEMLEIFLKLKTEELKKRDERKVIVAVITGRGKHSVDQVPRLKRAVVNYLSNKNITYHEKHAGLIEVLLTRREKF